MFDIKLFLNPSKTEFLLLGAILHLNTFNDTNSIEFHQAESVYESTEAINKRGKTALYI